MKNKKYEVVTITNHQGDILFDGTVIDLIAYGNARMLDYQAENPASMRGPLFRKDVNETFERCNGDFKTIYSLLESWLGKDFLA